MIGRPWVMHHFCEFQALTNHFLMWKWIWCQIIRTCLIIQYLPYFISTSSERVFFLVIYVYWPVKSKYDVHFRRPYPVNSDNPKKLNFPDYRRFPVPADGNGSRIWILQVEKLIVSLNNYVDNPKCGTITIKSSKTSEISPPPPYPSVEKLL